MLKISSPSHVGAGPNSCQGYPDRIFGTRVFPLGMGEDSPSDTGTGNPVIARPVYGPGWSDPIDISFHMEAPSCK